jgi:hypothetical protein
MPNSNMAVQLSVLIAWSLSSLWGPFLTSFVSLLSTISISRSALELCRVEIFCLNLRKSKTKIMTSSSLMIFSPRNGQMFYKL